MATFNYTDPNTKKKQTFNYTLPKKTPPIPVGGYPIKQVAQSPASSALNKKLT